MEGQTPAKLSLDSLMSTVLPSLDANTPSVNASKKFKRVRPTASTQPAPSSAGAAAVTTPHVPKNVLSDIAAAAQAAFTAPTSFTPAPTTAAINENQTNTNNLSNSAKKRNRKLKRKNNSNNQGGPTGSIPAPSETKKNQAGPPSNQKQGAKRKNNVNANLGKNYKRSKYDPQMIARNLDAQPELVGVSKDDDFSELLIQHVTHTNKMLQRDLQEQSRNMLAEQKRQAELLAAQVAGLTAPADTAAAPADTAAAPSTTPTPRQDQQHRHQHNINNQKSALQNKNNQGNNSNNGQPHQKRQQTPFVPKKDCMYFLQGECRKAVCTFKHDIEAQQAAMAAKEADSTIMREASRKARGVCNFEKVGSCAKGDMCPFSHDLSEEPCTYYHLRGICERGDNCRFGHTPIAPERLRKLREDLEVKLREKNEMQAMANANFIPNANATINPPGAVVAPPAFQMGVVSHGTQGLAQINPQGYTPGHPQLGPQGYTPGHPQLGPQGYIQHGP
ncbi:hypothetical protein KI688_006136 [Linnemannia hyalina]|uniref:C3H1-type domain-containing protein n=1 Tax=Linnemannia hyalina TaxID=64524 RepID=A0A9P7Y4F6_9FUNG|nr:hypothetical protein KI688_006136 [Linnemannia hyalina]